MPYKQNLRQLIGLIIGLLKGWMQVRKAAIWLMIIFLLFSLESAFSEAAVVGANSPNQLVYECESNLIAVCDDACLLDELDETAVLDMMRSASAYANVGFLTYPTGGSSQNSAEKARKWGESTFGADSRFVVFIIDMSTRHLDIYASKLLSGVLSSAVLNSIADNVYRYASRGEYGACAIETFRLVENALKDEERVSGEFIFRGNIRWGMSVEEVAALEGDPEQRSESNSSETIGYSNVPVSKYHGYLGYIFNSDSLTLCAYAIADADQDVFDYMKTALEAVYGDAAEPSEDELIAIISQLQGDSVSKDELRDSLFSKWNAAGNTVIYMVLGGGYLEVLYVSPELLKLATEENEQVNTTGL